MRLLFCVFFFFFSSRRRHTRSKRDWSSDVCSSDLSSALATAPTTKLTLSSSVRKTQQKLLPLPKRQRQRQWPLRLSSLASSSPPTLACGRADRKSTRLNSSHVSISYAVFCLKKKKP